MSVNFDKVKTPRDIAAVVIGTACGAGLTPKMPGTMGTLVAVPLAYAIASWGDFERGFVWFVILLMGIWAARVMDEIMESSDNQSIVVDEVVGFGITSWTCGQDGKLLLLAFVLFRAFDIIKPPPVRQIDRWSKQMASDKNSKFSALAPWWGGFGVMMDDVGAGFQGLIVILLLQRWGWI